MKKIPLLLILLATVFFAPQIASAESFELITDENYSYKNIKNVLIICTISEKAQSVDPYAHLNLPKELMGRMQKKIQNVTAHTIVQTSQLLDQKTEGEYSQLLSANNPNATALLNEFIADYYDVSIHVNIIAYNYALRQSAQKTLSNPLGIEKCANVRIEYSIINPKTNTTILDRTEIFVNGSYVEGEKSNSIKSFVNRFDKLIAEDIKKNANSK